MEDCIPIMPEKAEAAVKALTTDGYDFVYVHIEAPDEMGHQGSTEDKILAIERIDEMIVRPVVQSISRGGNRLQDADSSGSSDSCPGAHSYR